MNRNKPKYFKDNREISAAEALDARGVVRDGVTVRTHMLMQDGLQRFTLDDAGGLLLDGKPYMVPLALGDDGVARPTLDKKKILGPNGELDPDAEETERTKSNSASALLADGTSVADHRPHFGVVDRAALEQMEARYITWDAMEAERYKTAHSSSPSSPVVASDAQGDVREQAYLAYDEEMAAAHRKVR